MNVSCATENFAQEETVRIYGIAHDTIVDGPGLRIGIFFQGCSHGCPGCHNPESHDANGGTLRTIASVIAEVQENTLCTGVTLSGGDPIEQPFAAARLADTLKTNGYNVWVYTGYLYEDLCRRAEGQSKEAVAIKTVLDSADVLVDGPFIQEQKSYDLQWKGSRNQRVIDIKKTRETGKIVLWEKSYTPPAKPASW